MDREKRVLIVGGGVAALEAALSLRRIAEERVRLELLAPEPRFSYRPLSVAAPFEQGEIMELELEEVARELGADFTQAGLVGVDAWRHVAHTSRNTEHAYDLLLIACGALPLPAIPGALTFRGPADVELIRGLLRDLAGGTVESVAFVIPWGAVYSLPAYELALLTRAHLDRADVRGVEIGLVTPEAEPLQVFGPPASEAIRDLFAERGIVLRTSAFSREVVDDELTLAPEGSVVADRVVALPRLVGAPIDGITQTVDGFVPVDAHCRVHGVADVYAAGDITSFTVKHGGIATQQADAAAEAIAAAAGVDLEPSRLRPILRGTLLTGSRPRYLRRELGAGRETEPVASVEPLWWPPAKIVGRRLAPFLAAKAGEEVPLLRPPTCPARSRSSTSSNRTPSPVSTRPGCSRPWRATTSLPSKASSSALLSYSRRKTRSVRRPKSCLRKRPVRRSSASSAVSSASSRGRICCGQRRRDRIPRRHACASG